MKRYAAAWAVTGLCVAFGASAAFAQSGMTIKAGASFGNVSNRGVLPATSAPGPASRAASR